MDVMRVADGLWRWTARHPLWQDADGWGPDVASVYYEAEDAVVLVDPLVPTDETERFWHALDRDVERLGLPVVVVLTAPWHARSTDLVLDRYDGTLWAHPAAKHRLDRHIDAPVLPRGVEVFEVPPVSEGQVAVFLPTHGALVTGEVLATIDGRLAVVPSPVLEHTARLGGMLRYLLDLPVASVLPAHGDAVLTDAHAALAAAVAHYAPSAA